MSDKIKIPELDIEVHNVYEFNECASEYLTGFCEALEQDGGTRPITENDEAEETWKFMWTNEAQTLIDAEIDRLGSIGEKYFGNNNLELHIESYMYKEL